MITDGGYFHNLGIVGLKLRVYLASEENYLNDDAPYGNVPLDFRHFTNRPDAHKPPLRPLRV